METPAPTLTKSFKPRRRRLSPSRTLAYERLAPIWGVAESGPELDFPTLFGRSAPVVLDVGFGHGEATIELATREPDRDLLAVEVHTPGVARVLESIESGALTNVRVCEGDVVALLARIPATSIDEVRLFFPDPWPKARQRPRRLVRDDIVRALTDRLRPGGVLHVATDIADYAEQVVDVCGREPRLHGGPLPERPAWRPHTRFEARGEAEGRAVVDLRYERSG